MRPSSLAGRAGLYTVPQPFNLSTKARNKQRDARAQVTFHTLSRPRMTDRLRKSACAKTGRAELRRGLSCCGGPQEEIERQMEEYSYQPATNPRPEEPLD